MEDWESIFFVYGSKLGVNEGYVGVTLVGISGGEIDVAALVQSYLICGGK